MSKCTITTDNEDWDVSGILNILDSTKCNLVKYLKWDSLSLTEVHFKASYLRSVIEAKPNKVKHFVLRYSVNGSSRSLLIENLYGENDPCCQWKNLNNFKRVKNYSTERRSIFFQRKGL